MPITFQAELTVADFLDHTESNWHRDFVCRERPLEGRPCQDGTSVRFMLPLFLSRTKSVLYAALRSTCQNATSESVHARRLSCWACIMSIRAVPHKSRTSSRGNDCLRAHPKRAARTGSLSLTACILFAVAVTGNGQPRSTPWNIATPHTPVTRIEGVSAQCWATASLPTRRAMSRYTSYSTRRPWPTQGGGVYYNRIR